MSENLLETKLNTAISKFEKDFEKIQCHGYSEDAQCAVNELGAITHNALTEFKNAILSELN